MPLLVSVDTFHIYLATVALSVAAFIAVAGNILIVTLFMKMKNVARLSPHIFLTNLAVCDLLLGLKLPLFFLVTLATRDPWIFAKETACLVGGVADSFTFRLVVAGMIAVAVDRYLAVIHAVRYNTIMTEKRAFVIISLMWGYCLLWSLFPVIVEYVQSTLDVTKTTTTVYVFSQSHNMCVIRFGPSSEKLHKVFIGLDLILNFIIPLTVMTYCYLRIAKKILSRKEVGNKLRKLMRSTSMSFKKQKKVADQTPHGRKSIIKDSGIGIKIDGCDSLSSGEEDREDYVELPAVTKPFDALRNLQFQEHPTDSDPNTSASQSESITRPSTVIPARGREDSTISGMSTGSKSTVTTREAGGLSSPVKHPVAGRSMSYSPKTRDSPMRNSPVADDSTSIKDSARRMSVAVTTSVVAQFKRLSYASSAFGGKLKMSKYQQKIAKTTLVVYLSFFFCFTPFIVSQVLILVDSDSSPTIVSTFIFVSVCLVYVNASINVLIYGMMHRNVKKTLRDLFR